MRIVLLTLSVLWLVIGVLQAAPLSVKLRNQSGQALTQLIVTPKGGAASANLVSGSLGSGATASYPVTAAANVCVFELKFVLASGKVIVRPDTDLCQSDVIIVE